MVVEEAADGDDDGATDDDESDIAEKFDEKHAHLNDTAAVQGVHIDSRGQDIWSGAEDIR